VHGMPSKRREQEAPGAHCTHGLVRKGRKHTS
jgi:hypothetical protein